jgi:glycosyltransferase involved in cell wall biosynthesis
LKNMVKSAVSVIIPTFNRAPMIARAVGSALNQCKEKDEVIVIDDGSTDDTEQALQIFMGRIKYHRVQNGGVGYARNIGLKIAKNGFVAFLDSDDEWIPGKLSLQRNLLDARPDLAFCFSDFVNIDPEGREQKRALAHFCEIENLGERLIGPRVPLSTIIEIADEWKGVGLHIGDLYLVQMNIFCVQVNTVLLRREFIGDHIRFSEDLSYHEDWEFFSRLSRQRLVAYLDCETAKMHHHHLPRLTKTTMINVYNQRLKVLSRVWGEDEEFLDAHNNDFQRRKREQLLGLLEELSDKGMFKESREVMKNVKNPPIKYICIYYLPDAVVHVLLFLYQKIKSVFKV